MGWKQWSAVVIVIGGGILLQIPRHDEMAMDRKTDPEAMGQGATPAEAADVMGPFRTVALDVTDMT